MSATDPIPPVLTYAEPATNALPDWFEAVETMLDAREPVWKLSAMFPKSMDAVNYVIKSLARRFPREKVGTVCESCGQPCQTMTMIYWRVRIAAKTSEVARSTNSMPSESTAMTHHAMCSECHRLSYLVSPDKPRLRKWAAWLMAIGMILPIALMAIFQPEKDNNWPAVFGLPFLVGICLVLANVRSGYCRVSPNITTRLPADVPPVSLGPVLPKAAGI